MPRLRNAATGVVVNVDDATAERLGAQWKPVNEPKRKPAGKGRKAQAGDDK